MHKCWKEVIVLGVAFFLLADTQAQNKPGKQPKPGKQESVEEPPPPPPPGIEMIAIDTVLSPFAQFAPEFDTTAVPDDLLTTRIREYMQLSGQMELSSLLIRKTYDSEEIRGILPEQYRQKFINAYEPGGDGYKYIELATVRSYRKYYTVADIDELVRFYKTPTGQKVLQVNPLIMVENSEQGMKIGKWLGIKLSTESN